MGPKKEKSNHSPTIENRKARHQYSVLDTLETGIVLTGTEVKAIRLSHVSLGEAFVEISNRGELWLVNARIEEYFEANQFNHSPLAKRKLLAHAHEILKLKRLTEQKGMTLIPLKLYFKKGKVKVLIGICRGKKAEDKRATLIGRTHQREMDRLSKTTGMRI